MKRLTCWNYLTFFIVLLLSCGSAEAVFKTENYNEVVNMLQPRSAKKAQKKQDAKEANKKKSIKNSSREAQKRSYEIQTPEVQARMKQNKKDLAARDKARKKNNKTGTKKGAKKYR